MSVSISPRRFLGWRMVFIAFLAQNLAIGTTFGVYGTLLSRLESEFATTRSLASTGLALVLLAMGGLAPVVGAALTRFSIRRVMLCGALLVTTGYLALACVDDIYLLLGIYALLIGPGTCLMSVVPASTLVSNWFVSDRGKALGIVNMPVLMFIVPPVTAAISPLFSLHEIYLGLAGLIILAIPTIYFVIDRPENIGQRPLFNSGVSEIEKPTKWASTELSTIQLLRRPAFLCSCLGSSLIVGAGTMIVTHLVPLSMGIGFSLQEASLLASLSGVAGVVGSLAFGWLADRVGAAQSLGGNALLQGLLWCVLLAPPSLASLMAVSVLIGACGSGVMGTFGALLSELYGQASFGRAMGLGNLLSVPFAFGAAPFAGYLFDATGSYSVPIALHIGLFAVAAVLFFSIALLMRRAGNASLAA